MIAQFLAIFKNLKAERNERISSFLAILTILRQKELNVLLHFQLFQGI